MKIVEKFTDLDKASGYIIDINGAYKALAEEAKQNRIDITNAVKLLKLSEADVSKLTGQLADLKDGHILEIKGLNESLKTSSEQEQELELELTDANLMIAELGAQLAAISEISEVDKKIVTVKGAKFVLTGAHFLIPGTGAITLDALANNTDLLESLLAKQSSILTPVV